MADYDDEYEDWDSQDDGEEEYMAVDDDHPVGYDPNAQYASVNKPGSSSTDPEYSSIPNDEGLYANDSGAVASGGADSARNTAFAGVDKLDPDFDATQFFGAFWTMGEGKKLDGGFDELKKLLAQGNDFCRDIVTVFRDRAAIEETYSKNLAKLKAKAMKMQDNTYGTLKSAWLRLLQEFVEQSEWHKQLSETIKKRVCEPLVTFKKQQKKGHEMKQQIVDKAFKAYLDVVQFSQKCKRTAHSKSKDAEAAEMALVDAIQGANGKIYTDKDKQKLEKAVIKARKVRDKADGAYRDALLKAAQGREDWETAMIKGCRELQQDEEEKIRYIKRIFSDYSTTLSDQIANMNRVYGECLSLSQTINSAEDVTIMAKDRGTGPYVGVQELYDIYEESQLNPIEPERRIQVLKAKLELWKEELNKKEKAREGLAKLWEASRTITGKGQDGKWESVFAVKRQLIACDYALAAGHGNLLKLRTALALTAGKPAPKHTLEEYIKRHDDKGFILTTLRLPADFRYDAATFHRDTDAAAVHDDEYGTAIPQTRVALGGGGSTAAGISGPMSAPVSAPVVPDYGDDSDEFDDDDDDDDYEGGGEVEAGIGHCRALYDYTANEPDEISLTAGDVLVLFDKSDETWWQGSLNGQQGVFPAAYVEEC